LFFDCALPRYGEQPVGIASAGANGLRQQGPRKDLKDIDDQDAMVIANDDRTVRREERVALLARY
jgi:hypothetical protein